MQQEYKKENQWETLKKEWKQKIESMEIPEDTVNIHYLEHMLDKFYTEASWHLTKYKTQFENIEATTEALRKANGNNGNNSEERKAYAYNLIMYYPTGNEEDEDTKNLFEIRNQVREKYYFFKDYVMDNIKTKSWRLVTITGANKVEAQIGGTYGGR